LTVLLPALFAMIVGQTAFPDPIFMSIFPISSDARVRDGTVEIDARITGRSFSELTARRTARYVAPGRFVATVGPYPRSRDRVKKAYSECSFLVDCDEASVKSAFGLARHDLGDSMTMPDLTGWVSRYITNKTYSHDFDMASVVAKRREGDCTEHAVLLAALARSRKIPARIVTGLALLEFSGKAAAVGHAWVEWHDGKRWLPADAALSKEEIAKYVGKMPFRLSYLPVRILEREDAGFSAALLNGPDIVDISAVLVPAAKKQ